MADVEWVPSNTVSVMSIRAVKEIEELIQAIGKSFALKACLDRTLRFYMCISVQRNYRLLNSCSPINVHSIEHQEVLRRKILCGEHQRGRVLDLLGAFGRNGLRLGSRRIHCAHWKVRQLTIEITLDSCTHLNDLHCQLKRML